MNLNHLSIAGLKSLPDLDLDLHPLEFITGPNGSGKSAIRTALELVSLGEALDRGKTPAKILSLASNGQIHVRGSFDDDGQPLSVRRAWGPDGIETRSSPGPSNTSNDHHRIAILERLGDVRSLLALSEWLQSGPTDRRRSLVRAAGTAAGLDLSEIAAKASALAKARFPLPDTEDAPLDLWIDACFGSTRKPGPVKAAKKKGTDESKRIQAVLENLRAELDRAVAPTEDQRTRLVFLSKTKTNLDERLAAHDDATARRPALIRTRDQHLEALSTVNARLLSLPEAPTPAEIEAAQTTITDLDRQLDELSTSELVKEALRVGTVIGTWSAENSVRAQLELERADLDAKALIGRAEDQDTARHRLGKLRDRATEKLSALRSRKDQAGVRGEIEARAQDLEAQADQAVQALADLSASPEDLLTERAEIQAEIDSLSSLARDHEALRESIARTEDQLCEAEALKEAAAAVEVYLGPEGVQGEIAERVITPVVQLASAVTASIGIGTLSPLTETERGKPSLSLSLKRPDGAVATLETMSTGERAGTYAGLLVGFASVCDAHWKIVVIDSIESVDRERRGKLLDVLAGLRSEGKIDQAIVLGCPDQVDDVKGWNVRRL